MPQAGRDPRGTAYVVLAIDRHSHPGGDVAIERPFHGSNRLLQIGCGGGFPGTLASGMPQLKLGSGHDYDFNGGEQHQEQQRENKGEFDGCAPRLTHRPFRARAPRPQKRSWEGHLIPKPMR